MDMKNYIVFCPERGQGPDDGRTFMASSPAEAAKAWATCEDWEGNDYEIAGGQDVTVTVFDGVKERRFIVSGKLATSYSAWLIVKTP